MEAEFNEESIGRFRPTVSKAERYEQGKALRRQCPRESQKIIELSEKRDPVNILLKSSKGRIEELLPIKYGRMIESPFAFYRGSASIMAHDLADTPSTGINIQICGDCHLMNFGGFATPERKMVFDINDFDETSIAPWEWDVKRLATSFVIAGQWREFSDSECRKAALTLVNSYRSHIAEYADMSALQVWYSHLDIEAIVKSGKDKELIKFRLKRLKKAMKQSAREKEFVKLTFQHGENARIKDDPPLIYHADPATEKEFYLHFDSAFKKYLQTLSNDKKVLLSRYKVHDAAMKVVGVGSVGSWCGVALLMSATGEPLFLQFKQAYKSVLEPYAGKSPFKNNGQRVVEGQKLMQAASDIFLGWTEGGQNRQYYIRQLRDAKVKPLIEIMDFENFTAYARVCGWALARSHAKAGDASVLKGYMGNSDEFDEAIANFAVAYSRQNELDYHALIDAVKRGIIDVRTGI